MGNRLRQSRAFAGRKCLRTSALRRCQSSRGREATAEAAACCGKIGAWEKAISSTRNRKPSVPPLLARTAASAASTTCAGCGEQRKLRPLEAWANRTGRDFRSRAITWCGSMTCSPAATLAAGNDSRFPCHNQWFLFSARPGSCLSFFAASDLLLRVGVKSVLADISRKGTQSTEAAKKVRLNLNQPTVRFVLRFGESNQLLTYNTPCTFILAHSLLKDPQRKVWDLCV